MPKIYTLKEEAQSELYEFFDQYIRRLEKGSDGKIDPFAQGLINNDVDAMRHSYVSGVYTMEFNQSTAEILGRLYELLPGGSSSQNPESLKNETNMDLWNNSIGRKYGKKSKERKELFDYLHQALKKGELIIDIDDPRKYKGASVIRKRPGGLVIVIEESETGENLRFYDLDKKVVLSKFEFITAIKKGLYTEYEIRLMNGSEIPVAKRDHFNFNNLG